MSSCKLWQEGVTMRSIVKLALGLGLAGALTACSTSNVSQSPSPDWRQGSSFSVTSLPGSGMFTPVLEVTEDTSGATVTVSLQDAASVANAYVQVRYDASRYTPGRVDFSNFLGSAEECLTLAVTSQPGVLPLGATQVKGAAVLPQNGNGLLATIRFNNGAFSARAASKAPSAPGNAVDDLIITSQTALSVDLQWTEHHVGDYDNNGEVNIADMTPVGMFFNATVATSDDPDFARMVDGDSNGEVNLADLTPIGSNYGSVLTGYVLYTDPEGTQAIGSGVTVLRADQSPETGTPLVYHYTAPLDGGSPSFNVRPVNGAELGTPGPQSNIAEVVSQDGPPLAPTNLVAQSGQILGPGKIKLTWAPSTSSDVANYVIDSKLTSDDDTAWAELTTVTAATTTYTATGLTENSYDFRVWAVDFTADRSAQPSNVDSETPYIVVISPPQNPQAVSGGGSHSVTISWDAPADASAQRFRVYKKGPADSAFAELLTTLNNSITSTVDANCTAGDTYEYYMTGLDQTGTVESAPTATVSAAASADAPPVVIESITTDKRTHHFSGSEGDANLSITCNVPPDSVSWTASAGGNPTGSGTTATWKPTGLSQAQVVTITATATNAGGSDQATIEMYLTSKTIVTSYGGENIGNNGHFVEFNRPSTRNQAGENLSDYIDGNHVVTYNMWEKWCPPCRAEMPKMHDWAEAYGPSGKYWHVGHASTYALSDIMPWMATNGATPNTAPATDNRPWDSQYWMSFNASVNGTGDQWLGDAIWVQFWSGYGPQGKSLPRSILFDMDGNARMAYNSSMYYDAGVETDWENTIKELIGQS